MKQNQKQALYEFEKSILYYAENIQNEMSELQDFITNSYVSNDKVEILKKVLNPVIARFNCLIDTSVVDAFNKQYGPDEDILDEDYFSLDELFEHGKDLTEDYDANDCMNDDYDEAYDF